MPRGDLITPNDVSEKSWAGSLATIAKQNLPAPSVASRHAHSEDREPQAAPGTFGDAIGYRLK